MHSATWHKALLLFLWITPHVLLGVVAAIVFKRRLYRDFPCFLAYVLCEIAGFIVLFSFYSILGVTSKPYAYAFSITLMLNIVLRFGVISEVANDLFRESKFLKAAAWRTLQCVTGLLLGVGILLAVYAPGDNTVKWHTGISVVNRGAAIVQCGLLLFFLLFSRFLGLSWRRAAFGIALGLGILTSVDLAMFALRPEFSSKAAKEFLNLLRTGAYLICVSAWIGYLLAPELETASPAAVSLDEVETWNKELRHWLRD
jgi:hypothetical protein